MPTPADQAGGSIFFGPASRPIAQRHRPHYPYDVEDCHSVCPRMLRVIRGHGSKCLSSTACHPHGNVLRDPPPPRDDSVKRRGSRVAHLFSQQRRRRCHVLFVRLRRLLHTVMRSPDQGLRTVEESHLGLLSSVAEREALASGYPVSLESSIFPCSFGFAIVTCIPMRVVVLLRVYTSSVSGTGCVVGHDQRAS